MVVIVFFLFRFSDREDLLHSIEEVEGRCNEVLGFESIVRVCVHRNLEEASRSPCLVVGEPQSDANHWISQWRRVVLRRSP